MSIHETAYATACFCPMPGVTYKMSSGLGRILDETGVGRIEDKTCETEIPPDRP